jgi:hypothetical protein
VKGKHVAFEQPFNDDVTHYLKKDSLGAEYFYLQLCKMPIPSVLEPGNGIMGAD